MAIEKTWAILSAKADPDTGEIRIVSFSIDFTDDQFPGAKSGHGGIVSVAGHELTADSPLGDFVAVIEPMLNPGLEQFHSETLALQYEQTSLVDVITSLPSEADVNLERRRRIEAGTDIEIAGYGTVALQGRPEDQTNLLSRFNVAMLKIQSGDSSTMVFRDRRDVNHELTPQQMVNVYTAGMAWVETQYKASWALKAMSPIPVDFRNDGYWI